MCHGVTAWLPVWGLCYFSPQAWIPWHTKPWSATARNATWMTVCSVTLQLRSDNLFFIDQIMAGKMEHSWVFAVRISCQHCYISSPFMSWGSAKGHCFAHVGFQKSVWTINLFGLCECDEILCLTVSWIMVFSKTDAKIHNWKDIVEYCNQTNSFFIYIKYQNFSINGNW